MYRANVRNMVLYNKSLILNKWYGDTIFASEFLKLNIIDLISIPPFLLLRSSCFFYLFYLHFYAFTMYVHSINNN